MKKTIVLLAALAAFTMSANAQWFDFGTNVHRYDLGFNLGMVGPSTEYHDFGIGASICVWGVYVDFLTSGPMYKYDNRVASMNDPDNLRFLPDSTTTVVNFGYQIPVLPWLRVMPLIGFNVNTSGVTDMATHNAETSGSGDNISVSLFHDYRKNHTWTYFNFGGGLVASPISWLSIYGVYTTHAIYGGISFNLSAIPW